MRGEVGKETSRKEMDFYDVTRDIKALFTQPTWSRGANWSQSGAVHINWIRVSCSGAGGWVPGLHLFKTGRQGVSLNKEDN